MAARLSSKPEATTTSEGGYDDEDEPRWPDENEEASIAATLAEPATIREHLDQVAAVKREEKADSVRDLPPLEDLVERIPAEVREGLENLFRLKFTKVRRLPKRLFTTPPQEDVDA